MSLSLALLERSESKCELCGSTSGIQPFIVAPKKGDSDDEIVVVCDTCMTQLNDPQKVDANHWRCLNESMWSQVPSVQVVAYRMLNQLKHENWALDAVGMMYLDDETQEWADAQSDAALVHVDSNGHVLQAGDTVTLIQDLNVKGSSITAKRGTAVRRIRLDPNNAEYIEGKVDGQHIVILTKYVKKS